MDKNMETHLTDEALPLPFPSPRWIEVLASLATLIGIAGVIALLVQGAWAATPGDNPAPSARRHFNNPFANAGGASSGNQNSAFSDEDQPAGAGSRVVRNLGRPGIQPPPTAARGNPNQPQNPNLGGPGDFNMGGTPPSGVISNSKIPPLNINDETGEGSKEMVIDFNFPDADIMDIAKALGKLTGKNFILDKDVKGRITIVSNSSISVADAWRAFLTALDINGFALIPSGKFIRISRNRDARDKQLKTYTGDYSPDTDALITRVFPIKYISAEEISRTFRNFMPANSRIIANEQTNTVIVTDTGANIAKLAKLLEILDIEGYDAGIEVIPVKYASAAELAKLIDSLIPGTTTGGAPGMPRGGIGGGGRFSSRRTKEGGVINTIIADERTNTLIVHANTKGADQVRELVAKLDQKTPAQTGGGKVHVKYLQFAEAEAIANTLNNLSSGGGPGGFRPTTPGATAGTGSNPIAGALFEGAIKISPDKSTNSLVITASPADFETVNRVVNGLDIPRDEVYVEVIVMEIALQNQFNFSTNVVSPPSGIGFVTSDAFQQVITNPFATPGAILGFVGGQPTTVTIGTQQFTVNSLQGLITAIQQNTKSNILATPQVIALDNAEATFDSSEKIPVPVSTAVQGAGIQTSTTKENVSLNIKIKPQINKLSPFIKLDVDAKLEDLNQTLVPKALQDTNFATTSREAKTTVVVGDTDTVVLGGLTRDKVNETVRKIPILGDIPILGWLFKGKTSDVQKTNLLIFMTPHIIKQYERVRAILDKKLKERDQFIEDTAGGEDSFRGKRDEIIRSLPDVHDLGSKWPKPVTSIEEEKPAAIPVERSPSQPMQSAPQIPAGPAAPPSDSLAPGSNTAAPPVAPEPVAPPPAPTVQ